MFAAMKEILGTESRKSGPQAAKTHPVCLANEGELSIEMEKILNAMPNAQASRRKRFWRSTPTTRFSRP